MTSGLTNVAVQAATLNGLSLSLTATPLTTPTAGRKTVNVILPSAPATVVAEEDLRIARQYDIEVATRAEMLTMLSEQGVAKGQRILVRNDERLDGFWSIWFYNPLNDDADEHGLVFEDVQSYRTADFFDVIDWYAAGYSAAEPPPVTYATIEARNLAEGPNPAHTLVRVLDDGSGAWAWFRYADDGTWTLVARQNSTVRFKEDFYDPNRVVYGVDTRDASMIPNRDGSWELRTLFNILKTKILDTAELNELFFSMVHFLHSQQDQVDWAFKTSFLSVIGFNERLTQTPVQAYDTTQNLLDFIDEVKPYRVKTRDLKRILTPNIDQANVHATDFDKPLYFDQRLNRYRRLNPAIPADMEIMRTTSPWKDWYDHYEKTEHDDETSRDFNPVRNFRMKMVFDRVDPYEIPIDSGFGWDLAPWDVLGWDGEERHLGSGGSATSRLFSYQPGAGMVENNLEELLDGYGFRGVSTDAQDLLRFPQDNSEWDVRGYDTSPEDITITVEKDNTIDGYQGRKVSVEMNDDSEFYGLRDPYNGPGHPEEFVPVQGNEAVAFITHTEWTAGAPDHYLSHINTKRIRRNTVRVSFQGIAASPEAVLVFRDGVRAPASEYTLNLAESYVEITLGRPRPEWVMVHAFGVGGVARIIEQVFRTGDGTTQVYALNQDPVGYVEVSVDGRVLPAEEVVVSGRSVALLTPPAKGTAVLILTFEASAVENPVTRLSREVLPYTEAKKWDLTRRTKVAVPAAEHTGTIVELDGKRLIPPFTSYAYLSAVRQFVSAGEVRNVRNLSIWFDNAPYTGRIRRADPAVFDSSDQSLGTGIFVVGDELFVNDASVVGKYMMVVVFENNEYSVNDGVLYINAEITEDSRIEVTTFQNADLMDIQTYTFRGNAEGLYGLSGTLPMNEFSLISQNGLYLTCGVDFDIKSYANTMRQSDTVGWDISGYDKNRFEDGSLGGPAGTSSLTIPGGQPTEHIIVATIFRGRAVSEPSTWGMISAQPSTSMMGDPKLIMEWGIAGFDTVPLESAVPVLTETPLGERAVYVMDECWQTFRWEDEDPRGPTPNQGRLVAEIRLDTAEIKVRTPVIDVEPRYTFPDRETAKPGVIWLNGERIEYFELTVQDDLYTFRELRRSTRGTRLSAEQRRVASLISDGETTAFTLPGGTMDSVPEVRVYNVDGTHVDLQSTLHFLAAKVGDDLVVTLNEPIEAGANVRIGQSYDLIHPAGTLVRNATQSEYDRRKAPYRIRKEVTDLALTTAGYAG